jgi:PAS domain S-box-containing protein
MLNQSKKSIPDVGPDSTSVYLQEAQGTNADAASQLAHGADWFEQFFTSSSEMLCIIDGNGYFRRVNNAFADLLGYAVTELNGQAITNFVYPRDFHPTTEMLLQAQERNIQGFESRVTCSNGDVKWLSWSTTILEAGAMMGIVRDITGEKQGAEDVQRHIKTLEAAEERYKAFVHQSSEIIWRGEMITPIDISLPEDEQVRMVFSESWLAECNDHMAWFYGYKSAAEMTGKRLSEFFSAADAATDGTVRKFIQQGYKVYQVLSSHVNAQGHTRYFISNMVGVVEDGKLNRIWCTQNDITGQRRAEKALRDSEERYRHFIQQSSEGIWRFETVKPIPVDAPEEQIMEMLVQHGYLAECNETIAKLYGFEKASEMTGRNMQELVALEHPASQEFLYAFIRQGFNISNYELPHTDTQGNKRYFRHNLVGIIENGRLVRVWGTQQEVTEQHKVEETNRHQARVLENLFDAVISTAPDFTIRSWNHAAEKLYGLSAEEVTGHTIREFVTLDYHNTTRDKLLEELFGNGIWNGEASFVRPKDGKRVIFQSTISLIKDKDGNVTDTIGINKDITERTQAEHAMRESEERFRQLADAAPVMIWVSDENDNMVYVNKSFVNFTGVTMAQVSGEGWATLMHPDDIPVSEEKYRNCFKNRESFQLEYRLKSSSGDYRWVVDHGVPRFLEDNTFLGFIGSVMDIHDRKMAEEKIRFQAQVMTDVSDGLIATDLDFNIISFNKAAEKMYGFSAAEVVGKPIRDYILHHYTAGTREDVLKALSENENWEGEAYYDRKDGVRIYMLCSYSFVRDEQGRQIGFAGIHRDITERRKSEQALRISEERYRSVVHAMGEGIVMFDNTGKIIACNRSAEDIMGMPANVMESLRNDIFLIHEDGTPFPADEHPSNVTLKTGRSLQNAIIGVYRPDGELVWISVNTEPVYYLSKGEHPDAVVASFVDITQKKAAEIELQRSQQQLREYSERITNILDSITDGFIAVDKHFNILLWNHAVENITGIKANNAIGANIEKVFPEFISSAEYPQYIMAIERGTTVSFEHFIAVFDRWFETSVYPFGQGVFIYFREITERKKQEELLKLEKEVLKINAQSNVALKTTMDYLLEGLEKTFPGMLCSVLVLNDDKETVTQLSGPSLPAEYTAAVNGIRIGPKAGSCGTSMYRKEKVITEDIYTDPLWEDFRDFMTPFGLRACWSFPVMNAKNEVLATIAAYFRTPRAPGKEDLNILERVSNLMRIIIENKNAEVKIRVSNERYLLVTKATNDAIWDWDVVTNSLYWGEGFYTLFGYKPGYVENPMGFWESCIHDEDRERVLRALKEFIKHNNSQIWEAEYRFKKANGKYALVYDRGFLIFDHTGKINRMVGSMQDITEKKEMEKKLLKQELDKQKLVAQAVVNAQEKERAEIGKELHDNVNQILSTAKLYLELARTEEDERLDLIDRSTDNISNAINEIRTISRSLVPPSVGDLGLIDSIHDLVENIRATKKLQVSFDFEGEIDDVLDEKRKLMLFRIIQEQVNNVLRHAKATHLIIELNTAGNMIDLTIIDDGQGFDMEKVKLKKGVGLSNIISRAELFNGKVAIKTAPGKGCSLNINVPISNL